jgi:hypothetical protein
LISDQVLKNSQKAVPSPTEWFIDMLMKTLLASSVTCADSTGGDSVTASALTLAELLKGKTGPWPALPR